MALASNSDQLLLIAAREPVPGATKTRLGATIGMEEAAQLHRAFLRDLAARFTPAEPAYRLGWAFSPPACDFRQVMSRLLGSTAVKGALFVPQEGDDWATRQLNLLRWGYDQGFRKTVLISSDSPHLSRRTIEAAFAALDDADVAIGPVHDGGYYLIGMHEPHDILTGVPMSTSNVFAAVSACAYALGLRMAELETTFDIDVETDLAPLNALLRDDPAAAPFTRRALQTLGLVSYPLVEAAEELAATL